MTYSKPELRTSSALAVIAGLKNDPRAFEVLFPTEILQTAGAHEAGE